MSSKRSSNKNIDDLKEQINHLSLNLNPNELNSNNSNNNNKTPLINVYSNITSPKSSSSNSVQKLSELEEKLKEINLGNQNIEGYYKSIKTENQGIIPQIRRMELLQRKMNLLQNSNAQNSKALQEILEIEMKERLRYPKYTIIQNTPLTPHEEIMNQIIEKKLGPGNSYSMNYPTVIFKNQNEINEMRNIQTSQNNNNNINVNNNINNINNINNFGSNRVGLESNDLKPVTVKMIKEIQKEVLHLRKTVSDLKLQIKEMKENFKLDLEKDYVSNKLLVEIIRKVIEEGGDNKLKSSVEKHFDRKKINLDEIKSDLEIFKEEELNKIIDKEINKYDTKLNNILEKMQNDLSKLMNNKNNIYQSDNNRNNTFKSNLILVEEKASSKTSKKIIEKIISEESKKSSKISYNKDKKLNSKKESENSSEEDNEEEEEEEEEDDDNDDDDITSKKNKSKKNDYSSHKSKSKKSSNKKSSSKYS